MYFETFLFFIGLTCSIHFILDYTQYLVHNNEPHGFEWIEFIIICVAWTWLFYLLHV